MEPAPKQRERCECGAGLDPALDWCPQCYRPRPVVFTPGTWIPGTPIHETTGGLPVNARQGAPTPITREVSGRGRWARTDVTFGLTGRIFWSFLITLPILLFIPVLIPTGLGGIAVYSIVYIPGMRQIWRRADRRL